MKNGVTIQLTAKMYFIASQTLTSYKSTQSWCLLWIAHGWSQIRQAVAEQALRHVRYNL